MEQDQERQDEYRDAYERASSALISAETKTAMMVQENKQLRTDIEHLLAILDHVVEATGEDLDPDDACMVAQIRASPGRTGTDAAMMAGFDAINI